MVMVMLATTCLSLRLLRFAGLCSADNLLVCVRSIAWQPKTEVCTYVSAYLQRNRLHTHMIGLTFKINCNDNVEDDTYSNCIERDGIQTSLSRALHLYGCTLWFGVVEWLEVGLVGFPVGGGLPQYGQQGRGASLEQSSMEDELW